MRKRILIAIGVSATWIATLVIAAYLPPISKPLSLTAAYWIREATQVSTLIGTPMQGHEAAQTATFFAPTRTAIALTRNPSLAVYPTPNAIQLTATRIVAGLAPTHITATAGYARGARATEIMRAFYATEFIFVMATPPPFETPPTCQQEMSNHYDMELANRIQAALIEVGLRDSRVTVRVGGINQLGECETPFLPLRTNYVIGLELTNANAFTLDRRLADLTAQILSILIQYPPKAGYGPEPTRLLMVFRLSFRDRIIDTAYANALAAYNEGLRGEALLEALGGVLPG
ncbi:MAG: hypothetical protein L0Z53_05810 [Acidobacteriales bacterium]|nr:hypothetical protein [Terriglobales bacterium]